MKLPIAKAVLFPKPIEIYPKPLRQSPSKVALSYTRHNGAQRLINFEILVLVRSLKSSNVELGPYLDGRLSFKCCLSVAANTWYLARFD